jgi:plasmid stabilization system protein ParE
MIDIRWAEAALDDLERLYEFLLEEAPTQADQALERIHHAVDSLAHFPRLGRSHRAVKAEREFHADFGRNGYVIRYRLPDDTSLLILRVFHSRELR